MKTPSPQELAALVHRLKYLAGPTILTPCAESDAADALTAQAARIAELEQTVALQSQQRISESVDANVRLGNVERECAELRKYKAAVEVELGQWKTYKELADAEVVMRQHIDATMSAKPTEARHE